MTVRRLASLTFVVLGCFFSLLQATPAQAAERITPVRVAGDFDRDHHSDFAVAGISGNTLKVRLHLSGKRKHITLTADVPQKFGLHLSAFDIDQDSDADIVLIDPLLQTSAVWINQGNGEFQRSSRFVGRLIDGTKDGQFRPRTFRTNVEPAARSGERLAPGLVVIPALPNPSDGRALFLGAIEFFTGCSSSAIFSRAPPSNNT